MRTIDMSALSVLVADPNPYMVKIIRAMLRGYGITSIHEATDGAVALEAFKIHDIDIAIVDYALTTLNGIELTEFLRGDEANAHRFVHIIMLSVYIEKKRARSVRHSGITE